MLTPAQLVTLRAACFADPTAAAFFVDPGNSAGLEAYLNSATTHIVWRESVSQDEIMQNGFDWAQVDNLSVGKARIWEWLFNNQQRACNPSKPNVRAGIDECWKGTAAMLAVRTAVYAHCRRPATVAEKAFASGVGTEANPATLGWSGSVWTVESSRLIYHDDGTIWTAQE